MIFYNVFMCMCVGVIKKLKRERERENYILILRILYSHILTHYVQIKQKLRFVINKGISILL